MIDHDLLTHAIAHGIADALPTSGSDADTARLEAIGAALRRGWDSAAPTSKAPAELEAQPAGPPVKPRSVTGECLTGDGTAYLLCQLESGDIEIWTERGEIELCVHVRRADLLAALGLRGDL